jgi:transcriptional regulator with XRE-family HTH domain
MNEISYNNWMAMSDNALAQTIGSFVKHHRLLQNKSQDTVAVAAGISRSTLSLLERGEPVMVPTLLQVLRVLDLLYVLDAFKLKEEISPIVLAKLEQKKRKRARSKGNDEQAKSEW